MSVRKQVGQIREALQSRKSPRRAMVQLRLDQLEDRMVPIVGAFSVPNPIGAGAGWDGVVELWNGGCTGSLLSSGRHILTAAHCLTDGNGQINTNNVTVNFDLPGRRIAMNVPRANFNIHTSWRGWNTSWNGDIAVLTLPALAPSGPRGTGADRYEIHRTFDEVNQLFAVIGYGRTGTGNNGDNVAADGRKRFGQNRFERVEGTRLQSDFDNGNTNNDIFRVRYSISNTGLGANENMTAPGDSGGPSFVNGRIAAVTSSRWTCNCATDVRMGLNSSFGDWAESTRVASYAGWIDGILGGRHELILDMQSQLVGQDANPDSIEVRRAGNFIDFYVNGLHYHRASNSLVNTITLLGSGARDVFYITDNLPGTTVNVDGRGGIDEIVLSNDLANNQYNVYASAVTVINGGLQSVYHAGVEQVTVNAGLTESVTVRSTAAATPVTISGAGSVVVGDAGGYLGNIRGTVTVRNPPDYTNLTIDNSGDTTTRSVTITATSITGLAPAAINWVQNDIRSLTIRGGNGLNTYRVENTPNNGVAGGVATTLIGGTGIDTMNVLRTNGRLAINGNGNIDVVNLGNAGSLAEVYGAIDVSNPPTGGYTALTVDASAFTGSYIATLTDSSLTFGGPMITFRQVDLRALTIRGGRGASTYNVLNTPQSGFSGGVTTTLIGGPAVDTVNIRRTTGVINTNTGGGTDLVNLGENGSMAGILGSMTLSNAAGSQTLVNLFDQNRTGARTVTLDNYTTDAEYARITGLTGATIYTRCVDTSLVQIFNGSGAVTTNVLSTCAGLGMNVTGNGAGHVVNLGNAGSVQGIRGAVSLSNTGGRTEVNVNNGNDTANREAVIDRYLSGTEFVRLTGLAPAPIYSAAGQTGMFTVNGGQGHDTYHVLGTYSGVSTVLRGGGGDDQFAVSDGALLDGIQGYLSLNGEAGTNFATINDGQQSAGRSYLWSGDTLQRDGMDSIGFYNLINIDLYTGAGDDALRVTGRGLTFLVTDLGGFDTVTGPDADTVWTLVAANTGYLDSGLGFYEVENLMGGLNADTFVFQDGASISSVIDGAGGVNTLDYSAYTTDVYVNLNTGAATGVSLIGNISNVTGGFGNDVLVGVGGNVLQGGSGRDLLIAGGTASTLEGGEGDDLLIGGTTAYDLDEAALFAIRDYLAGADDYATRVANLTAGAGVPVLDASTVFSNGGGNALLGGEGLDLLFGSSALDLHDWNGVEETLVEI